MASIMRATSSTWDLSLVPTKPCKTMNVGRRWPGLRPSGTCKTPDSFRPSDLNVRSCSILSSPRLGVRWEPARYARAHELQNVEKSTRWLLRNASVSALVMRPASTSTLVLAPATCTSGLAMISTSWQCSVWRNPSCTRAPPKRPGETLQIVVGFRALGLGFTREIQSMAFFRPPGMDQLYSGVTIKIASTPLTAATNAVTLSGMPSSRMSWLNSGRVPGLGSATGVMPPGTRSAAARPTARDNDARRSDPSRIPSCMVDPVMPNSSCCRRGPREPMLAPRQRCRFPPDIHDTHVLGAFERRDHVGFIAVIIVDEGHAAGAFHHRATGIHVIRVGVVTRAVPTGPPNQHLVDRIQKIPQPAVIGELGNFPRIMVQPGFAFDDAENMVKPVRPAHPAEPVVHHPLRQAHAHDRFE